MSAFSRWWVGEDGVVTKQVFDAPTFRQTGNGWAPVDPRVRPNSDGDVAASAEAAVRPIRFGRNGDNLVRIMLDRGPVRVTAPELTINEPEVLADGSVLYRDVAVDTDLRFRVTGSGVLKEFVLRSASAPRSFTLELRDPQRQLGYVKPTEGGGFVFSEPIDGEVMVELPPAVAFEQPREDHIRRPFEIGSATQTMSEIDGGYEFTLEIDEDWLVDAEFPVVLDPSVTFTNGQGLVLDGHNAYEASGCGGCYRINDTAETLGAGTYADATYDFTPLRSFFAFDLAGIPVGSYVHSGDFALYQAGCLGVGDHLCDDHDFTAQLHAMTDAWTVSSTWDELSPITATDAFASRSIPAFAPGSQEWHDWNVRDQIRRWVDGVQPNHGFALRVADESPNRGGPLYRSSEHSTGENLPYMTVVYTPPEGEPPPTYDETRSANAFVGGGQAQNWTGKTVYDDGSVEFPLPFRFPLYDLAFDSVYVGANGYLTFGSPYTSRFPSISSRKGVFSYGKDLFARRGGELGQDVFVESSPDEFRVRWRTETYSGSSTTGYQHYQMPRNATAVPGAGAPLEMDQSGAARIDLPFEFPFFGERFSRVDVCTKGYLSFSSDCTRNPPFNPLEQIDGIVPFGAHGLDVSCPDGGVFMREGLDSVAVVWQTRRPDENLPTCVGGARANFEAEIFSDGQVIFRYGTIESSGSQVVGISNGDGVNYRRSSKDRAVFDDPVVAARDVFTPNGGWPVEFEARLFPDGDVKLSYADMQDPGSAAVGLSRGDLVNFLRLTGYDGTTIPGFADTVTLTRQPSVSPPALWDLSVSPSPFTPDFDGLDDTTTISARSDRFVDWTLDIRDSSESSIRSFSGSGTDISQVWDGKDDAGVTAPSGTYTAVLTVTDIDGRSTTETVDVSLERAPRIVSFTASPRSFSPDGDGTDDASILLAVMADDSLTYTWEVELAGPYYLDPHTRSGSGSVVEFEWEGDDPAGWPQPNGEYQATITVTDDQGESVQAVTAVDIDVPLPDENPYLVVSQSPTGTPNSGSWLPAMSADGRFVAFTSTAADLVAGDTNGVEDVFVYDRSTRSVQRVSVGATTESEPGGRQADADSDHPSLSADGRYVAFTSRASNLLSADGNGHYDVFIHDRALAATTRVSVSSSGTEANGRSEAPSLSANGQLVAFSSRAENLIAADTNLATDIFVHDRDNATTRRVSISSSGQQGDGVSDLPSISDDGSAVLFRSFANTLVAEPKKPGVGADTLVHDLDAGTTESLSVAEDGLRKGLWSGALSGDGRFAVFRAPGAAGSDGIVHRDRSTGAMHHLAVDCAGTPLESTGTLPEISGDSSRVVFWTRDAVAAGDTDGEWDPYAVDMRDGAMQWLMPESDADPWGQHAFSALSYGGNAVAVEALLDGQYEVAYRDIDTATPVVPCGEAFGFDGHGGWKASVNAPLGNFVTETTDIDVPVPGPALAVTRTYNSRDRKANAFGKGWTFAYDMSASEDAWGNVTVLFPDGRREVHRPNGDGTYKPPPGYFSKLDSDGAGGFLLTQKDFTRYFFDSSGKLASIIDRNDRSIDLIYAADGTLQTATWNWSYVDGTGGTTEPGTRQLHFQWTNRHISEVSTDPVTHADGTTSPLVWRYYYSGDLLTEACDPRDNAQTGSCIRYAYTNDLLTRITRPKGNTQNALGYSPDGLVEWSEDGEGNRTTFTHPQFGIVEATDARQHKTRFEYDQRFRVTAEVDPLNHRTEYRYDLDGNRDQITDANGTETRLDHDERGNLISTTCVACAQDANNETAWFSYDDGSDGGLIGKRRRDTLLVSRDPRSTGAADDTYATGYTYDDFGNRATETLPATPQFPGGVTRTWTYTFGDEPAFGGVGTQPRGLLATAKDARGNVTTYSYDRFGDLRVIVDRAELTTQYTYDQLGRKLTETVVSDTYPAGVTTTWTYDKVGSVTTVTEPAVTNAVTSETHQQRTTNVYDANDNLHQVIVEDIAGADATRTTTYDHDNADRQWRVTDPETGVLTREFDPAGNVFAVVDQEGRRIETVHDPRNLPDTVTMKGFDADPEDPASPLRDIVVADYGYDNAGRKLTETDAEGRTRVWRYDGADRATTVKLLGYENLDGTTRTVELEGYVYDRAGNVTQERSGGGKRKIDHTYDQASWLRASILRLPGTTGPDRTTTFHHDANGNLVKRELSNGTRTETTEFRHDAADRVTREIVHNDSGERLVTALRYDQRGHLLATTDPRGVPSPDTLDVDLDAAYTTDHEHDQLGRATATRLPSVDFEENGGPAFKVRPTTLAGYDTFGNATHTQDPRDFVTTTTYDALDRVELITHPSYVDPDGVTILPTESFGYDRVGNLTSRVSRRNHTTRWVFDSLNRVVRQVDPPLAPATEGAPVEYEYDDVGNRTAEIDQVGARTEWTHDDRDRVRTMTQVVRRGGAQPDRFTWTHDHDDLGNLTFERDPEQAETTHVYNSASERVTTVDAALETWTAEYDVAGRLVAEEDPLGRRTEYRHDLAGRQDELRRVAPNGAVLTTESYDYDAAGNRTGVTTPRDFTTVYDHDAANRLTGVTVPVSTTKTILTSYGYDAAGNVTRFTNGRGLDRTYRYNAWNLRTGTVEPATAVHPDLDQRTFATGYDAGGLPVTELQPGVDSDPAIRIDRSFDALGRVTVETGEGAGPIRSAQRRLDHDAVGRLTTVSHPSGDIVLEYDDRDLVRAVTGPAGNETYTRDGVGRVLTHAHNAVGVQASTFTWTDRGELETATEPLTTTPRTFKWDAAGQLDAILHGPQDAPLSRRDLDWDDLGRLRSDRLLNSVGLVQFGTAYAYDDDDNVETQTITAPGNPSAGEHRYTYDRSGRLDTWTAPGGALTEYGYDDAGNRTKAGVDTYSFDERDQLTTGPDGTYEYLPIGTLRVINPGVPTCAANTCHWYEFDSLGRQHRYMFDGSVADFTHDGLDRIATRNGVPFRYAATGLDPVADGDFTYARSPAGRNLAVAAGPVATMSAHNRHGDLVALHSATGQITTTRIYDPFGVELARTGTVQPHAGYQGDYTDPHSHEVWMGARWYDPTTATFTSRDTVFGELHTPVSLNRYAYAHNNPLRFFDPDGRDPIAGDGLSNESPEDRAIVEARKQAQREGRIATPQELDQAQQGAAQREMERTAGSATGSRQAEANVRTARELLDHTRTVHAARGCGGPQPLAHAPGGSFLAPLEWTWDCFQLGGALSKAEQLLASTHWVANEATRQYQRVLASLAMQPRVEACGLFAHIGSLCDSIQSLGGATQFMARTTSTVVEVGLVVGSVALPLRAIGVRSVAPRTAAPRATTPVAAPRAPVFADTDVLVNAQRGHAGALAEIRAGTTYVSPNQFNEFVAGGAGRRAFMEAEGIQVFTGPQAGQIAGTNAFQKPFQAIVGAQGRGDAALAAFARATGYEAITMDRRLINFITQTLRDPSIPIRGIPR